jgi:hypothetical protein
VGLRTESLSAKFAVGLRRFSVGKCPFWG